MFLSIRASLRPLVLIVFLTVASVGTALADNSYGGTDPPKTGDAIAAVSGVVDETADPASFWAQLSALLAQWFAAMN